MTILLQILITGFQNCNYVLSNRWEFRSCNMELEDYVNCAPFSIAGQHTRLRRAMHPQGKRWPKWFNSSTTMKTHSREVLSWNCKICEKSLSLVMCGGFYKVHCLVQKLYLWYLPHVQVSDICFSADGLYSVLVKISTAYTYSCH